MSKNNFHKNSAIQDQKNTLFDKHVLTCILDLQNNMVDISKAFLEFIGYKKEDIINQKYALFTKKHMEKNVLLDIKNTLNLGMTFEGEIKNSKKNGEEFWLDATISPLKDEDGIKLGYMCIFINITHERKFKEMAITDTLTSLYNRNYFDLYLKQEFQDSIKEKSTISLLLFSIDYFKNYNKFYGKVLGDEVIVRIANALKNNKYIDSKNLFKIEGKEFAIIIKNKDNLFLRNLINSTFNSVKLLNIKHEKSDTENIITLSAGVVSIDTAVHSQITTSELITLTNNKLQNAKETGRNKAVFDVEIVNNDDKEKINYICTLPNREALINSISLLQKNSMLIVLHLNHINILKNIHGINGVTNIIAQKSSKLKRLILDDEATLYNLNFQEFAILVKNESLFEKYFSLVKYSILEDTMVDVDTFEDHDGSLVSCTAGIAYGKQNVLNRADVVLQEAILENKSYLIYEKSTETKSTQIDSMEKMKVYKKALLKGKIIPYFQPIVDSNTGEVFKYEALARIIDDDGIVVSPLHFLSASKKDKTFEAFSKQMMQKVFNVYSKNNIKISINITYENIMSKSMVDYIQNRLEKYGGSGITFELVESEEIKDYKHVENFIIMIKSYGCKVSIDDFGSGYSNFTNILLLNIDFIKIDGSLIEKLNKDENVLIIVKALLEFTKNSNMETIAEYVSNEEIAKIVKELGIDFSQGFYYSKPKTPKELNLLFDEI